MVSVSAVAITFLTVGYFFKIKEIKSPEMTEVRDPCFIFLFFFIFFGKILLFGIKEHENALAFKFQQHVCSKEGNKYKYVPG